jgi:cilia- and flagella-associated protein 57
VLDYKIKELKRDIAPRGLEITKLKKETNDMDRNLKHYNKINANLGYIVDDLRTRQEHMGDLIKKNKAKIRQNENFSKGFKNAIYWVVQYIDDFDQLKWAVNKNLYPYVKDQEMKNVEIDPDIKKEYENQRKYLENSQASLKKRLEKEQQIHKEDNMNIMRENIKLIKMISDLRLKVKELVSKEKNTRTIAKMRANQSSMMNQSKEEGAQGGREELTDQEKDQQRLELEQKRQTIDQYRRHINELHQEQEQLLQEQAYFQQM